MNCTTVRSGKTLRARLYACIQSRLFSCNPFSYFLIYQHFVFESGYQGSNGHLLKLFKSRFEMNSWMRLILSLSASAFRFSIIVLHKSLVRSGSGEGSASGSNCVAMFTVRLYHIKPFACFPLGRRLLSILFSFDIVHQVGW